MAYLESPEFLEGERLRTMPESVFIQTYVIKPALARHPTDSKARVFFRRLDDYLSAVDEITPEERKRMYVEIAAIDPEADLDRIIASGVLHRHLLLAHPTSTFYD